MTMLADPISASRLDAWLDQTEASLEEQVESDVDPALIVSSLLATMQGQRFRADTLPSVRRLFRLWLHAGAPEAALQVLAQDGPEAVAALPEAERALWRLSLAFWRLEPLSALGDQAALQRALEVAHTVLKSLPPHSQSDEAWAHLSKEAESSGAFELTRRCALGRFSLSRTTKDGGADLAWDQAMLANRQARSHVLEGDAAQARAAAMLAIDHLAKAAPDQKIGHADWLSMAQTLVDLVPDTFEPIAAHVAACVPSTMEGFARLDIDVRVARLHATALQQRGALDQALAQARLGRTQLRRDREDRFSARVFDWLIDAGRFDEAAHLAFELVLNEQAFAAAHVAGAAWCALDERWPGTPWWDLTLACAALMEGTAGVCGDEDATAFVRAHLEAARRQAGDGASRAALAALEALLLIKSAQDWSGALPLLEAAVAEPLMANAAVLRALWEARFRVLGADRALAAPIVQAQSACASYGAGVFLGCQLNERLPPALAVPETPLNALSARYYQAGLTRFESFLASRQGHLRDGEAHTYAKLCNNLGIFLQASDRATSLQLHQKGILASPFAENYLGVMDCHRADGRDPEMVDSADRLWHYSADQGFSRHDPTDYVDDVAAALHRLGRHTEIAIWLERLDAWWGSAEEAERAGYTKSYVRAQVSVLFYMAHAQPEDVLLRLEPVLPQIAALGCPYICRHAGHALRTAAQYERALAMYDQGLGHIRAGESWNEDQRAMLLAAVAETRDLQRQAKPWWKPW